MRTPTSGSPRALLLLLASITPFALLGCVDPFSTATAGGDDASDEGSDTAPPVDGGAHADATPDGHADAAGTADAHADAAGTADAPATDGPVAAQGFDVEPSALQTLTVTLGQAPPGLVFHATMNGSPVTAAWSIDRPSLGTLATSPASQATLTPAGNIGGLVDVSATLNGQTLSRPVFIELTGQQNGANPNAPGESTQIPSSFAQLGAGGGIGGVGGEGLGPAVSDAATLDALTNPGGAQGQLTLLYPYDQTVFPRGLLAPLVQWTLAGGTSGLVDAGVVDAGDGGSGLDDADAVELHLATTSGSFTWTGTFAPPAVLQQTGGGFIRHPIPEDIWEMATNTAGGPTPTGALDQLMLTVVVARGGVGYAAPRETWTIAAGPLVGTVYYDSYGTMLVQNSPDLSAVGKEYGAAVLAIRAGATAPVVAAGTSSPAGTGTGCRVCHSAASGGSLLIAQQGNDYMTTSAYALQQSDVETVLSPDGGPYGWAGISADGTLLLTSSADLSAGTPLTQLFAYPLAAPVGDAGLVPPLPASGLPAQLQAGTPAFSPDGKHVSFDFIGGTLGALTGDGSQLVAMNFDPTTYEFSSMQVLATVGGGAAGALFPSFFPTSDAVAYQYQLVLSSPEQELETRNGAEAQIWWSDLATGTAAPLSAANGLTAGGTSSYLPSSSAHPNDTVLNYEPTMSPMATAGYAWVIFTSRRLYGNVATTEPWQSDPRMYDAERVANATCKKLWVAAIDLNAPPGTDPSHPAFYLPAQELLAGNARGSWALDP
jgi:hypothetical protein